MARKSWLVSVCTSLFLALPAAAQWGAPSPGVPGMATNYQVEEIAPLYDPKVMAGEVADDTPLVQAIINNDHATLRKAIRDGADINKETADGSYPIILANIYGDVELLKILTAHKVDVTKSDRNLRNVMHYLAMIGDTEKAKFMMILDNDFADEADRDNITPLYYAYFNNQMPMWRFLVDIGQARVNRVDRNGVPLAFMVIDQVDNPSAVTHMIENNLNVFRRNRKDLSLIEVAEFKEHMQSAAILRSAYDRILRDFKQKLQQENQPKNDDKSGGTPKSPAQRHF